jgi:hypothetical protein
VTSKGARAGGAHRRLVLVSHSIRVAARQERTPTSLGPEVNSSQSGRSFPSTRWDTEEGENWAASGLKGVEGEG